MRGDLCPYDHGLDPVIVEDVPIPTVGIPYPPPGKMSTFVISHWLISVHAPLENTPNCITLVPVRSGLLINYLVLYGLGQLS